jgi:hypothetical protein
VNLLKERHTTRGKAKIGTYGTLIVGVVLLVLTYCGVTFGMGTDDKSTVLANVLAFDVVMFGGVAAVVALAAYLDASGKPDLSADLWMRFSEKNDPMLKVDPPGELGTVYVSQAPSVYGELVIHNASTYAARNPSVVVKLHGLGLHVDNGGWDIVSRGNGVGATELQWDGGADRMIHGLGPRKLPPLYFNRAFVIPGGSPGIEVTMYADGTEPTSVTFSVRLVDDEQWSQIMKARASKSPPTIEAEG